MSIPSRTEAISVAQENISIDAARYERRIEALLMVWDGATEIRLDVPGHDAHIVPQLVKSLKDSGFAARSVVRANVTKDWIVYFK
jgi:hypothetical protein